MALHCYPKTKTNMFVITCSLGKFSGDQRLSDSDMPPAKAWFDRLTTLSNVERAKTPSSEEQIAVLK
jgi:hypothetical protein